MTRDCSSFGSSTAGPVQTGPFGGAPLQTNLFGCSPNRLAIPWFHFEPTYANGKRDPWHANSDMAIGHPPRFFVGHSWMVCRPQKRPTHSEHPGEPKIETWPSLFWIDVWRASDRATRWALVTFGFGFWLHWWRRSERSLSRQIRPSSCVNTRSRSVHSNKYWTEVASVEGLFGTDVQIEWLSVEAASCSDDLWARGPCADATGNAGGRARAALERGGPRAAGNGGPPRPTRVAATEWMARGTVEGGRAPPAAARGRAWRGGGARPRLGRPPRPRPQRPLLPPLPRSLRPLPRLPRAARPLLEVGALRRACKWVATRIARPARRRRRRRRRRRWRPAACRRATQPRGRGWRVGSRRGRRRESWPGGRRAPEPRRSGPGGGTRTPSWVGRRAPPPRPRVC